MIWWYFYFWRGLRVCETCSRWKWQVMEEGANCSPPESGSNPNEERKRPESRGWLSWHASWKSHQAIFPPPDCITQGTKHLSQGSLGGFQGQTCSSTDLKWGVSFSFVSQWMWNGESSLTVEVSSLIKRTFTIWSHEAIMLYSNCKPVPTQNLWIMNIYNNFNNCQKREQSKCPSKGEWKNERGTLRH